MLADIQRTLAHPIGVYDEGPHLRYVGPNQGIDGSGGIPSLRSSICMVVVVANFSNAPDGRPIGVVTAWKEEVLLSWST